MSGGIGTYAGGFLPGDLASQLAGRALIGGVIGGASAEFYGGKFADGFTQGAMTASSAFLFNEMMHTGGIKGQNANEKNPVKTSLAVMHVVEGTGMMIFSGTLAIGMYGIAGFLG